MAELSLICPSCKQAVNVPIEPDADAFTCELCGASNPIHDSLDGFGTATKDPLIGGVVSECEIQEKVGEGGFGAVYKAFDRNLQRPVALKVMLQSLTSNLEFVQKFIREAVTAAQLNHPNIVAIHKVGRDEERNLHFLIMEFLEGRTLSDVIEERDALPLDETIAVILQCADALAVAQDKNIIHRDIKPENIMIDQHGVVKITDFGLAKTLTTDMKSTKVVGTPHYMSPEQFEGKPVDGRTDIYSLGITFYYMLTKAKPYQGTNTVQIIYSILTQDPRPVMEINPEVPEEVWRIIRKMIAKDVDERYQSFRDARRDLLAFQERSLAQKISCPQCSAVNVRGRKFCRECGASLMVRCPQCAHEDLAGTRHCGECGAHIEGLLKIRDNLERGDKLRAFGDLKRAMAFYQEVLNLDPEHEQAQEATKDLRAAMERIEVKKAKVDELVSAGDAEEALVEVNGLLSEFPKSEDVKTYGQTVRRGLLLKAVDAHLLVAEKALDEGRLEDALSAYGAALDVDPDRQDIESKISDLKARVSALDETLSGAEKAVADGRNTDAISFAKEVLRLKPDHDRAAEILREAKEKVASSEAFVNEAQELLEAGDYEGAIGRLETAVEVSPGDDEAKIRLSDATARRAAFEEKLALIRRLLVEKKPEEALSGADELLDERPGHATAQGLKEEAEKILAEKAEREGRDALTAQGRAAEKEGDLEGALSLYLQVLEQDPENEAAKEAREAVEESLEEARRLERLAGEHIDEGKFGEAVDVFTRLLDIYPNSEDLRLRAEEASTKKERIDAALSRASDALKRKRYDVAIKAAEEALGIAPKNTAAAAVKRDSERGLAAIEKFMGEARRLIDSELFDDALLELNKAVDKGAPPAEVAELRQAADEGKMMLLKSEATRSFVFKDFAQAIEKYEAVLQVEGDDVDAKKGIKLAEKAIRSREREGVLPKALLSLGLMVVLFLTLNLSLGRGAAIAPEPVTQPDPDVIVPVVVDDTPKKPELAMLGDWERAGVSAPENWSKVREDYAAEALKFPDQPDLDQGVAFWDAMLEARDVPEDDHRGRLVAYRAALDKIGSFPTIQEERKALLDPSIRAAVDGWVRTTQRREQDDWAEAEMQYSEMLRDTAIKANAELRDEIVSYQQFAAAMRKADTDFDNEKFEQAYDAYDFAVDRAQDQEHVEVAEQAKGQSEDAWVKVVRGLVKRARSAEGLSAEEFDRDVIEELAKMVKKGVDDRETLYSRVTSE